MKLALIYLILAMSLFAGPSTPSAGTLIIFRLNIESSYANNFQRSASEKCDTVQWWITGDGFWRIRTYAIDSDIHPYRLVAKRPVDDFKKFAIDETKAVFGAEVAQMTILEIPSGASEDEITVIFRKEKLPATFEWVLDGYLFWKPDTSVYVTKSNPKKG